MSVLKSLNGENTVVHRSVAVRISRKMTQPVQVDCEEKKSTRLCGFGPMTRITTSFGEMHAQTLRERDMVRTRRGEYKKIEWIDRIVLGEDYLKYHPKAQPILIRAGSLGRNLPRQDVMFAPHQPISPQQAFTGSTPKCAIDTLGRPNVMRKTEQLITYTLFHCGEPTSVMCEGMWVDVNP